MFPSARWLPETGARLPLAGVLSRAAPMIHRHERTALAADPVSAFGGILATNQKVDLATAEEINKLFYEILVAPEFDDEALEFVGIVQS